MFDEAKPETEAAPKAKRRSTTRAQDIQLGIAAINNRDALAGAATLRDCAIILKAATSIDIADSTARDILEAAGIPLPAKPEKDRDLASEVSDLRHRIATLEAAKPTDTTNVAQVWGEKLDSKIDLRMLATDQKLAVLQASVAGYSAMIEELQTQVRLLNAKPEA